MSFERLSLYVLPAAEDPFDEVHCDVQEKAKDSHGNYPRKRSVSAEEHVLVDERSQSCSQCCARFGDVQEGDSEADAHPQARKDLGKAGGEDDVSVDLPT